MGVRVVDRLVPVCAGFGFAAWIVSHPWILSASLARRAPTSLAVGAENQGSRKAESGEFPTATCGSKKLLDLSGSLSAGRTPPSTEAYFSMMETTEFLFEAVSVLGAAVVVVVISSRLRIPPVAGFLISGILIGPSGLALVPGADDVEVFAEVGVVLLLFVIGLQLSASEMKTLGRSFLVGGSLQWALTAMATMAVVAAFGVPLPNALFIGFVVSLSSTAVVLKEYQERREATSSHGKVTLGVLLFQDLLIVPMIALTPVLAGVIEASPSGLAVRFGGGLAAVALVYFVGRRVISRLANILTGTRIRELLVLGALTICLALASFTAWLEFSLALGAFLAGVLVAETEYSHQVIADIGPFRDVFASIFFVSIGMLVEIDFALANLPRLVGLALLLVAVKALIATAALRLAGFTIRIALVCGIGLAQIGEFSFVLMEVGRANGLLQGERFQVLLAAAALTVAVTPLLVRVAPPLGSLAARLAPGTKPDEEAAAVPVSGHVVVVGYGMNGSLLTRILGETSIPHVLVELDPDAVRRARRAGVPVLFGDATRRGILEQAGVERAKMVVFVMSDFASVVRALKMVREISPDVEVVVRTQRVDEIDDLRRVGAGQVVSEEFESAIEIFTRVLSAYRVPRNVIRAETRVLRGEAYNMLRSAPTGEAFDAVLEALQAGTTDIYRVGEGAGFAGMTLRRLDLRQQTGASIIAVVRGDESHANPSADFVIEAGDSLVLVGGHEEIDRAFRFLDG
jgi:CPA2 family monovalent cation:H+ antiporter-2